MPANPRSRLLPFHAGWIVQFRIDGGVAIGAILSLPPALGAAEAFRPNILWLVSLHNGPFNCCYGDMLKHTPTLDKLSREGVVA